ncbi:MAG: AarF/UbiB family protein, partial [Bdellovibrionales bacterium]|nr:AarF/UbiB family protein [Bdellovibrionales bacterium]
AVDYVPESKIFNPQGMVNEFSRSISLETNFVVEANNIKRFQDNFAKNSNVKIPDVYFDISGPRVLVMEELQGLPMSHPDAFDQSDVSRAELMKAGLRAYFSMVFRDGLFHGDLHAGNIFILPGSQLGFIDFGMVGRLSRKTQGSIANMFVALSNEDYDRLAYEYVELAPFSAKTDRYALAQDLRSVLSPFFGLNLNDVNMGKLLLESSSIAAKHHVVLPSELMMFFKSMVTIEGLGRMVLADFDLLPFVYEFSAELLKTKVNTKDLFSDLTFQAKEWTSLVESFPKEIKSYMRKINQADYTQKFELKSLKSFERTLFGTGRMIFVGVIVSSLVLSGSITAVIAEGQRFYGLPVISIVLYAFAAIFFFRYLLKNR